MDTSDVYPDLFGDALSYSSQRMAQLASLVTAAATVESRRKTQRNAAKTLRSERGLRELHDQERAASDSLGTVSRDGSADDSGVAQAAFDFSAISQAEQRGQQIVRELQARALAGRGYALSPDELVTTLGATTTLPGDVIARLARADSQDRVAWEAERIRADDLGSASAAVVPGGTERGEYLTAAAQTRLTADTAAAHAAGDRNATRLAAESFPCTVTDAVTAAAAGAIQSAPSAVRANQTVLIRRPGRSA